jgi:hypothetical protein
MDLILSRAMDRKIAWRMINAWAETVQTAQASFRGSNRSTVPWLGLADSHAA